LKVKEEVLKGRAIFSPMATRKDGKNRLRMSYFLKEGLQKPLVRTASWPTAVCGSGFFAHRPRHELQPPALHAAHRHQAGACRASTIH
jgi:hypothetical protein